MEANKQKNQELMINLLNDIPYRTEFLNKLSKEDRIKASSLIERYSNLSTSRLKRIGKLYGNKKEQFKDSELRDKQVEIRIQLQELNY